MTSAPTPSDDWRRQLTRAFGILLDRPLSEYPADASYGAFLDGNHIDEFDYNRAPEWVRPAVLDGTEPLELEIALYDVDRPILFDGAKSVFEFDGADEAHPAFAADLAEVAVGENLVRGADLAVLVARHGVDLADEAWSGRWYVTLPKFFSDGTLYDAMRVALSLGEEPGGTLSVDVEPDDAWAAELKSVEDPALRAHVSFFCAKGTNGMTFFPDYTTDGLLTEDGGEVIGYWEEAQCQVEVTVVRLSGVLA
ncbi:hypothetical protein GCM10022243_67430 [Saccharothrix violaceirubra]|uniref:Uncharacterized protein n=1 Tax=Saccharothrix violaceirubra TaxID=413306 RepID=A0A7W7T302_9PSEU|nr:hypothetical protein [Saccharothrix violaceirubra]MBB4965306.1 hypothetical protein [Saccharothrix violaceirubra]